MLNAPSIKWIQDLLQIQQVNSPLTAVPAAPLCHHLTIDHGKAGKWDNIIDPLLPQFC